MSNVIKGNYGYSFRDENTKVIDTNRLVENKLEELSRIVRIQAEENGGFEENFTQGLEAMQVERLLADNDGEDEGGTSNVIKAQAAGTATQAREAADAILEEARAEASRILDEANAQAQTIRQEAQAEGQRVGYDTGFEKGEDEARAEYESRLQELDARGEAMQREFDTMVASLEPKFVEVFTDVYEHVFHVSLSDNKEVILYLIQDALRKAENSKSFIIHVSGNDYEFIQSRKGELLSGLAESVNAELVEDITLGQGQCFIDTGSGIFDCSVDTQLAALKKELRLLSYMPGGAAE